MDIVIIKRDAVKLFITAALQVSAVSHITARDVIFLLPYDRAAET